LLPLLPCPECKKLKLKENKQLKFLYVKTFITIVKKLNQSSCELSWCGKSEILFRCFELEKSGESIQVWNVA
jgi:hypothetical protein